MTLQLGQKAVGIGDISVAHQKTGVAQSDAPIEIGRPYGVGVLLPGQLDRSAFLVSIGQKQHVLRRLGLLGQQIFQVVDGEVELTTGHRDGRAQFEGGGVASILLENFGEKRVGLVEFLRFDANLREFELRDGDLLGLGRPFDQGLDQALAFVEVALTGLEISQCDLIGEGFPFGADARHELSLRCFRPTGLVEDADDLQFGVGVRRIGLGSRAGDSFRIVPMMRLDIEFDQLLAKRRFSRMAFCQGFQQGLFVARLAELVEKPDFEKGYSNVCDGRRILVQNLQSPARVAFLRLNSRERHERIHISRIGGESLVRLLHRLIALVEFQEDDGPQAEQLPVLTAGAAASISARASESELLRTRSLASLSLASVSFGSSATTARRLSVRPLHCLRASWICSRLRQAGSMPRSRLTAFLSSIAALA